jgi:uncharacterized protein
MPNVDKHAPGSFCWVELATTDQSVAKDFYARLFGWTPTDYPIGPDRTYTMFRLGDRNTGAAFAMSSDERAIVPPHWSVYIAVEDAVIRAPLPSPSAT